MYLREVNLLEHLYIYINLSTALLMGEILYLLYIQSSYRNDVDNEDILFTYLLFQDANRLEGTAPGHFQPFCETI